MKNLLKRRAFRIVQPSDGYLPSRVFDVAIMALVVASCLFIALLLMLSSLLMYHAEHAAQPEAFRNAFSGLWWAVATLTTVGYGDIYPVTAAGRLLGAVIAILGIGMVAIPTGILSSGFIEHFSRPEPAVKQEPRRACPHCGKEL